MKVRLEKRPTGEVRLMVKVADLHEDPANARQHDERSVDSIRSSYQKFGQQQPVVIDKKGKVAAGNGALRMAKVVGMPEVWVTVTGLDGVDLTSYSIADNRSSELAGWDFRVLTDLFKQLQAEGVSLDDIGWNPDEVEPILAKEFPSAKPKGRSVKFTEEQMDVVRRVVKQFRSMDKGVSFGGAVERICKDCLAGVQSDGE